MQRYLAGDTVWPDGWTKLRVYFVPRPAEIKPLADAYRRVLQECDFVTPIRDELLHETVAVVQDRPAAAVTTDQFARFEVLLRQRLADLPSFTATAGGALASRHGVMLDLTPDTHFVELQRRARSAVAEVFGAAATRYESGRPHVALAYGSGPGDSGVLQGRLRNATGLRARLTVDSVRIVEAVQDPERNEIRWWEKASIPLGAATPSGHPFDVSAFLARPLTARLATEGPTVRPIWYLFEDEQFWFVTGPSPSLTGLLRAKPRIAVVVDVCDPHLGDIKYVHVRGRATVLPYDVDRGRRLISRYLGKDESRWMGDTAQRYLLDAAHDDRYALIRLRPARWTVRDIAHGRAG